jgi:hypothetical protein
MVRKIDRHSPVSHEADAVFPQQRKQLLLASSDDGIVVALVHARLYVAVLLTDVNEALYFGGGVVGEAEILEFALLDGVVHCLGYSFEWRMAIGKMQIHGLDRISL